MPTLDQIRACFSGDRYATETTGVLIQDAQPGACVCTLPLRPELLNAVAANGHSQSVTVSQHASVTFLSPAKGQTLTARASCLKAGRQTCLYAVEITDELGTYVAHVTVNGFTLAAAPKPLVPQ